MNIAATLWILFILFYVLGRSADIVIANIRVMSRRGGLPIGFIGILLGLFTSLPEMAVGINATINGIQAVSVGNLIGGVIVLFGLILGFGILLHRSITTDGSVISIAPILLYLMAPIVVGRDALITRWEGVALVLFYGMVLSLVYRQSAASKRATVQAESAAHANIIVTIIALAVMMGTAQGIVRMTTMLVAYWQIPALVVGLLLFAIGTNLPEIIVTVRSRQRSLTALSLHTIFGSAIANVAVLGAIAILRPIQISATLSFVTSLGIMAALVIMVGWFYTSGKRFTASEGVALISLYGLSVAAQLFF